MRIKYKLFFSSLIIVAIFLLAGYYINSGITNMGHSQEELITAMRIDIASKEYLDGARALQAGVYLSVHKQAYMGSQVMKEGTDKMSKSRINLRKLVKDPVTLTSLTEAERLEEKVVEASNDVLKTVESSPDNTALIEQNLNTVQGRVTALELKLKDLDETAARNTEIAVSAATEYSQKTIQAAYIGIIVALLMALIVSFEMASLITNPLKSLTEAANVVSKGGINEKINVNSNDEIGELAVSFKRMINAFKVMDAMNKEK